MKSDECEHSPQEGTIYTTLCLPGSMNRRDDFPLEAMCAKCSMPIRREKYDDPQWDLKPLPTSVRLSEFKKRHPEISASAGGRASWFSDDGPHAETFGSTEKMLNYLEARFDG